MKKRAAAFTLMISLAAVTGCNDGGADYVTYNQTAPSEFEEQQKLAVSTSSAVKVDDTAGSRTQVLTPDVETPGSAIVPVAASDVAGSESVSPSIESDADRAGNSAEGASTDRTAEDSGTALISTAAKSVVSEQPALTGRADAPEIDNSATQESHKIELLIPEKSFRRERGTDAVRISYDDIDLLKVLNMEPVPPNAVDYFPEWLSALDGRRVRIRGWMFPTFVSEGLTSFTLARDNGICCFVRKPKIYDVIFVSLEKGQSCNYIDQRPFDVEGTFRIDSEGDGSELPRLYRIEDARVLD